MPDINRYCRLHPDGGLVLYIDGQPMTRTDESGLSWEECDQICEQLDVREEARRVEEEQLTEGG